jgi:fatty acid/phospholipid biosynthesis enzyme
VNATIGVRVFAATGNTSRALLRWAVLNRFMSTSTPGSAARRLAFLNFSVEMSKKRDARRNFSQYLKGDNFMGESVQCQTERCML